MKQNQQFTIGLVAAAVVLGGYMYFVESKKEAPTDSKDVEIWSLSDAASKDLNTLYVKDANTEATYTRSGDDWKLSSQPDRQVDKAQFDAAFNPLKNLMATQKLEDKPSDKAKYGLQTPLGIVRWGDQNSKYTLELGNKTPTGDSYYVHALKDDGLYIVAGYKVESLKNLASKPPLVALPSPSPSIAAPASGAAVPSSVPTAGTPVKADEKETAKAKPATSEKAVATPSPAASKK